MVAIFKQSLCHFEDIDIKRGGDDNVSKQLSIDFSELQGSFILAYDSISSPQQDRDPTISY